ncbi:hypothetical protein DICSQDRAFT_159248 [Dichomitus squalens LYAD-421 SS1]|uniref:uncharacterized protein n=1 Tax=Dichomitus squalens (strain LYAD-421) TaxID=732165 RepID=UPI0004413348|nr:uncharacterized protein DICSQDRAFT_159248 [Dichomitus squalens LYAD-421 SS1]EJF66269.1 hypothetical protein DICSQDRAFT_159248 [Dichomitus squalens LYAD-421 SS1]
MRFFTVAAALLPVGVALAQTTHVVKVGGNASLTYTPNQLTGVANGDVIQFQFLDKNHTVTQSTFAAPCSNITDATGAVTGVDSGFQFVPAGATQFPVWQITVNNASAPLWFFCRQATHCQAGMVFAVNPTAAKTYDAFKANAAQSVAVNGSPAPANGTTGSTGAPASSASGSTGGAVGTAAASGSTPSPSAAGTAGNGASALSFSGVTLLSLAGLSLGLLL